ncbi:MAG: alpha/beta hydrolase, partial [Bacteroidota bacterium]|nr:alpha/beta hydrolase [Bacteroidota bacterium]
FRSEGILKAAYALRLLKLIETEPTVPENIEVHKDIVYKQVDSISLQLDIYKQKNLSEAAPVLIFIHGGGWSKGKRSDYLPYLLDYAQKGYVTVTVSYRLSGVALFPAAVQDVQAAVQWIRDHSTEHMINPEKVALIGGSAGGHLAMMAGYADEAEGHKVQAVVNLYGPTDLTTEYARNRGECLNFLGKSYMESPDLYRLASPLTHISSDDPPTLIFHGTIDSLVPVSQSDSLHRWLDRAGVPNEYHRLKGWPHTMDLSTKVNDYCQYYMDAFLQLYL